MITFKPSDTFTNRLLQH